MITWLHPNDCDPPHGLRLGPGTPDSIKVDNLVKAFKTGGFNKKYPALVGYPLNGRIQLLSGTHRHRAALLAGIELPVTLFLRSYVEAYWGTEDWETLMSDIPVSTLEIMGAQIDIPPGINDRVTLP